MSLDSNSVNARFNALHATRPDAATDWFFSYCKDVDYIQTRALERNVAWTTETKWGPLEITVNLSKPEKDPKAIAAAREASARENADAFPRCALCMENEGYPGRGPDDPHGPWPDRSNLRIVRHELGGETWGLQYSPYAYYEHHCIVMSETHRPMHIDRSTFENLLEFTDWLPHYFIGSNADLPIVGGSILAHDHYQGGRHEFAMMKAKPACHFQLAGFDDVGCSIVEWPLSVIRLESSDRTRLSCAADKILQAWMGHDDESVGIVSRSPDATPHNTITPIARKARGTYVLDLALRCNVTSDEHPLGVFHPHERLHRVKRENIGLIEVMGLAILPPRLLDEFKGVAHDEALQQEVGEQFAEVLEDCGVFKWDDAGRRAFGRFIDRLT